jgi:hypothetical protein
LPEEFGPRVCPELWAGHARAGKDLFDPGLLLAWIRANRQPAARTNPGPRTCVATSGEVWGLCLARWCGGDLGGVLSRGFDSAGPVALVGGEVGARGAPTFGHTSYGWLAVPNVTAMQSGSIPVTLGLAGGLHGTSSLIRAPAIAAAARSSTGTFRANRPPGGRLAQNCSRCRRCCANWPLNERIARFCRSGGARTCSIHQSQHPAPDLVDRP